MTYMFIMKKMGLLLKKDFMTDFYFSLTAVV